MEKIIFSFISQAVENNETKILKKGQDPCECVSKNKNNSKCEGDAYWRWDKNEYCDRHLPLEARLLFVLNKWVAVQENVSESENSESENSESENSDTEEIDENW